MLMTYRVRFVLMFAAAVLIVCSSKPAVAQADSSLRAPVAAESRRIESESLPIKPNEAYGTQDQEVWVGATEFYSRDSGLWQNYGQDYGSYFWSNVDYTTTKHFEAQVHLPSGAHISFLRCDFRDSSTTNDASVGFWQHTLDSATLVVNDTNLATVISSGSAGVQTPGVPTNITIQSRVGTVDSIYTLVANMPPDANVAFRGCRFTWNRQVSPASATATFADVPPTHLFYQYVEALAASGITAGCGGGNYCPDAAVTRGQMAVFLSKALGLHWAP